MFIEKSLLIWQTHQTRENILQSLFSNWYNLHLQTDPFLSPTTAIIQQETLFIHQSCFIFINNVIHVPTAAVTCYKPPVVAPRPHGDVFSRGAAEETQRAEYSLITVTLDSDEPEPDERSPVVRLLLCRPDQERNVAVVAFLLPHLKRWSFEDVSVHHCHRADEAPFNGEICYIVRCPGGVLLPRDVLGRKKEFVQFDF